MKVNLSDLMIVNRAIAHDNMPKEKSFFRDDEDKLRAYMRRKSGVMSKLETTKDIEKVAVTMLNALPESEAKKIRKDYRGDNLKIIVEIVSKHCDYETLGKYAPRLLALV